MRVKKAGKVKLCKCGRYIAFKNGKFKHHRQTFRNDSAWCTSPVKRKRNLQEIPMANYYNIGFSYWCNS